MPFQSRGIRREIIYRKGRVMKKAACLSLSLLIISVLSGCAPTEKRSLGSMTAPARGMISKEELRDLLNMYRDYYVLRIKRTADWLDEEIGSRRIERTNLQMRMRVIGAVDTMLEPDDSVTAFLEIWGFVIRMRNYLEEGEGKNLYGDQQSVVINFAKEAEAEIERIGKLFLDEQKFEQVRQNLVSFASQNPIKGIYTNLIVLATKVKKEETAPFLSVIGAPMAPFRAMEGVDRTADAIYQIRNSVDHFTDVVKELPETTRWETVMLLDELDESPMTESFLTSLEIFSDSTARLADTAETLPLMFEQMDQSQAALQETLKLSQETSIEIRETVDKFTEAADSFDRTGKTLQEMAVAWDRAAASSTDLVQLFKTKKQRGPGDPPPFTMHDFDAMVVKIGQTADKVNAAAAQFQNTLGPEANRQITRSLNASIDHLAKRILQLLLAAFVLMLAYHYLTKKRTREGNR